MQFFTVCCLESSIARRAIILLTHGETVGEAYLITFSTPEG